MCKMKLEAVFVDSFDLGGSDGALGTVIAHESNPPGQTLDCTSRCTREVTCGYTDCTCPC